MATIAYTSSQVNPKVAQVDKVINLSAAPVASVQLYGAAEDTGDPGATFTYKWYIIDQPGGAAFISPDTNQNPTFGPISNWGNYLLMLVATSSGPGGASDGVVYRAPTTAFVQIRVQDEVYFLERPAKFARKWAAEYRELVTKFKSHAVEDHPGITTATTTALNIVTGGGPATDTGLPGGVPLHTHEGDSVDPATTATNGVVTLLDAPLDPNNPVVLNRDWFDVGGSAAGSQTQLGWTHLIMAQEDIVGVRTPHIMLHIREDCYLEQWAFSMVNGGAAAGFYNFRLRIGTAADFAAGTSAVLDPSFDVTAAAATDGAPLCVSQSGTKTFIPADRFISVYCLGHPAAGAGWGLTAVLHLTREV